MVELLLRFLAVFLLSIMLIAFGWYFSFGTDTLQHDWVYFGAGFITLLSGIGVLLGTVGMLFKQVQEWGVDGLASDNGESYEALAARTPAVAAAGGSTTDDASA